jgi:hypothetical protein
MTTVVKVSWVSGAFLASDAPDFHAELNRLVAQHGQPNKVTAEIEFPFGPPCLAEKMIATEFGRKISAIKAYRDRTGASLLESKKAIEAVMIVWPYDSE